MILIWIVSLMGLIHCTLVGIPEALTGMHCQRRSWVCLKRAYMEIRLMGLIHCTLVGIPAALTGMHCQRRSWVCLIRAYMENRQDSLVNVIVIFVLFCWLDSFTGGLLLVVLYM